MTNRNNLIQLARTITAPVAPFTEMPAWYAGQNHDSGQWFIADNGQEEFTTFDRGEFCQAFADIAIVDLNVALDGDESAVSAAISAAIIAAC